MPRGFLVHLLLVAAASFTFAQEDLEFLSPDKPLSDSGERMVSLADRQAQEDEYAARHDGMGVSVVYGRGVPELICSPLRVCILGLEVGEYILSDGLHVGDPTRWHITPAFAAEERTELIIKPVDAGLETNLSIHTSKRTYIVDLVSRRVDHVPYLSFRYPNVEPVASDLGSAEEQWDRYYARVHKLPATLPAPLPVEVAPGDYSFAYKQSGCKKCRSFRPERIFHDGQRTYIDLPERYGGELPEFWNDMGGGGALLEARWHKNRLIVDGIVRQGRLQVDNASFTFHLVD